MKFNFKKIASVLASVVMLGSTVGIAAAANYPAPFVSGGAANVAVVYGSNAAFSDGLAAGDIQTNLQAELAKQTATSGTTSTGSISGESAALSTGGSKIYVNDTLNLVKTTITKSDLPTVLADYTFSGNVDSKLTQTIVLGANPQVIFAKAPTNSDEPTFVLSTSTNTATYIYNATVDFGKAVNFTHADSKNQEIVLFGQKFTVGSGTDSTNLILFKEATKVDFDSSGTTSKEVTIGGATYTVELVSASTSAATIKVTNAAGSSEQKEVNEGYSKKINGVTIAVNTADSNNLKYTASVVAGAEKMTLATGVEVKTGDSDKIIDGTKAVFTGGTNAMTKLVISMAAKNSDTDAIRPGGSYVDPVFGSIKLDFPGLNIADDSTARESIKIYDSGNDKSYLKFTDARGNEKAFQWAYNITGTGSGLYLQSDDTGHNIIVGESTLANVSDYVILGNADEGRLMKVKSIYNSSSSTISDDYVTLQDVMSGDETTYNAASTEGSITMTVGGKTYTATYNFASTVASEARQIRIDSSDSSSGDMIIYPSLQTSKGAKIMFYKPLNIDLDNMDGSSTNVANIKIPNCDQRSYQSVAITMNGFGNYTVDGTYSNASTSAIANGINVTITNTGLIFNLIANGPGTNQTNVTLVNPQGGARITDPALIICEEKDDNSRYNAMVVTLDTGSSSSNALDVSDVIRTWQADGTWDSISTVANSNIKKEADLYGSIITIDASTSGHQTAEISYPDNQIYADLYIGAIASSVTAGTSSSGSVTEIGNVLVKDSEVSSVSTKNLIVVGGSCINTVAAKILGSDTAKCAADFTAVAGVGANQALIKVVTSPYAADKVAMLVAGYEAADTTKAVKYITTEKPATAKDTTVKLSTSSTVATVAV